MRLSLWEHTGSNRGPSACKADALNQLSYAPKLKNCISFSGLDTCLRDCKGNHHFHFHKTIFTIIFLCCFRASLCT